MKKQIIILLFLVLLGATAFCASPYDQDQDIKIIQNALLKRFLVDTFAEASFGYDNNISLNDTRQGAYFQEFKFYTQGVCHINDSSAAGILYYVDGLHYNDLKDYSSVYNKIGVFASRDLFYDYKITVGADIAMTNYPHDSTYDYFNVKPYVSLRHEVLDFLSHAVEYAHSYKRYFQLSSLNVIGEPSIVDRIERKDIFSYLIDFSYSRVFFKAGFMYTINDSNDNIQKY